MRLGSAMQPSEAPVTSCHRHKVLYVWESKACRGLGGNVANHTASEEVEGREPPWGNHPVRARL